MNLKNNSTIYVLIKTWIGVDFMIEKKVKKQVIIGIILFLLSIVSIYKFGEDISQFILDKLYKSRLSNSLVLQEAIVINNFLL